MIDIKQLEVDSKVLVQFTYKNQDSYTIFGTIVSATEENVVVQPIGFWGCTIQGFEMSASSKPPFSNNTAKLTIELNSILKLVSSGSKKLIQLKRYT